MPGPIANKADADVWMQAMTVAGMGQASANEVPAPETSSRSFGETSPTEQTSSASTTFRFIDDTPIASSTEPLTQEATQIQESMSAQPTDPATQVASANDSTEEPSTRSGSISTGQDQVTSTPDPAPGSGTASTTSLSKTAANPIEDGATEQNSAPSQASTITESAQSAATSAVSISSSSNSEEEPVVSEAGSVDSGSASATTDSSIQGSPSITSPISPTQSLDNESLTTQATVPRTTDIRPTPVESSSGFATPASTSMEATSASQDDGSSATAPATADITGVMDTESRSKLPPTGLEPDTETTLPVSSTSQTVNNSPVEASSSTRASSLSGPATESVYLTATTASQVFGSLTSSASTPQTDISDRSRETTGRSTRSLPISTSEVSYVSTQIAGTLPSAGASSTIGGSEASYGTTRSPALGSAEPSRTELSTSGSSAQSETSSTTVSRTAPTGLEPESGVYPDLPTESAYSATVSSSGTEAGVQLSSLTESGSPSIIGGMSPGPSGGITSSRSSIGVSSMNAETSSTSDPLAVLTKTPPSGLEPEGPMPTASSVPNDEEYSTVSMPSSSGSSYTSSSSSQTERISEGTSVSITNTSATLATRITSQGALTRSQSTSNKPRSSSTVYIGAPRFSLTASGSKKTQEAGAIVITDASTGFQPFQTGVSSNSGSSSYEARINDFTIGGSALSSQSTSKETPTELEPDGTSVSESYSSQDQPDTSLFKVAPTDLEDEIAGPTSINTGNQIPPATEDDAGAQVCCDDMAPVERGLTTVTQTATVYCTPCPRTSGQAAPSGGGVLPQMTSSATAAVGPYRETTSSAPGSDIAPSAPPAPPAPPPPDAPAAPDAPSAGDASNGVSDRPSQVDDAADTRDPTSDLGSSTFGVVTPNSDSGGSDRTDSDLNELPFNPSSLAEMFERLHQFLSPDTTPSLYQRQRGGRGGWGDGRGRGGGWTGGRPAGGSTWRSGPPADAAVIPSADDAAVGGEGETGTGNVDTDNSSEPTDQTDVSDGVETTDTSATDSEISEQDADTSPTEESAPVETNYSGLNLESANTQSSGAAVASLTRSSGVNLAASTGAYSEPGVTTPTSVLGSNLAAQDGSSSGSESPYATKCQDNGA